MDGSTILPLSSLQQQQRCSNEWVFMDVPTDITIYVGDASFELHKFPLVAQSGRIRKLIAEHRNDEISSLDLHKLPGGAEAFELATKFCYGINFEITSSNVAQLCCLSDYLEMTEEFANENLASRAEAFLDAVVCKSLEMCVEVLHQCEKLLPLAEELQIVGKCTTAIASKTCAEQIASSFSRLEYSSSGSLQMSKQVNCTGSWWIEDISVLRSDMYQRVIAAMKCRGVHPESIGKSLVNYAERQLMGKPFPWSATSHPRVEIVPHPNCCKKKLVIETIVSLLPVEKFAVPVSFLFGLLRSALMLECTMSCRVSLERRIASQLEMATLDDLLLPARQHAGETIFDVETVHRILVNFSQQSDSDDEGLGYNSDGPNPPSQIALNKVAKLVDNYLAEIALDPNLRLAKFMVIADALPGHARSTDDGLYRAIDIYLSNLKAHEGLSDLERRRLFKLIDFQKLSKEASAHAAQNERLPIQAIVEVLYIEQLRLRSALYCSYPDENQKAGYLLKRVSSGTLCAAMSPRDNYASLRRENRELKLELAQMRMRLNDLEKGQACIKHDLEKSKFQKLWDFWDCLIGKMKNWSFFHQSCSKASISPTKSLQGVDAKITGLT